MDKETGAELNVEADVEVKSQRTFTPRALGFGLLGLLIVAVGANYHHTVLASGVWMISHHMPPIVFAYLMLLGIGWNGGVGRWLPRWRLTPNELMVVMTMTFLACFPASAGLMRYALRQLALPWYYLSGQPDWQAHGLLETLIPGKLFPTPTPYRSANGVLMLDETVYRGFFHGIGAQGKPVGLGDIPWANWLAPMVYWGPLVATMSLSLIAMAFIVHRQWAQNEQLSYPVAQVARSFWHRRDGEAGVPDIFRNSLFWWGFVPLFLLYQLDYISCWFPESVPGIEEILPNLKRWTIPITQKIPVLRTIPGGSYLSWQRINFAIVGIAYFVSSEISFTMGVSQFMLTIVGVSIFLSTGKPLGFNDLSLNRAGAYFGYTLILLFTGRTWLKAVFGKAFFLRSKGATDATAILAARVLVLAFSGFVLVLWLMGCDFIMSLFYGLALMMLFLVFNRIICETGVPFMQPDWTPTRVLVSLFGPATVGPRAMTILGWTHTVIAQDPRECLMPYVSNSIHMADRGRVRLQRFFLLVVATVALAVVVAFISHLWVLYKTSPLNDGWSGGQVPKHPFQDAGRWISELKATGDYAASATASGLGKFRLFNAQPGAWTYFLSGTLLVMALSTLRFRFARFPLHPVLFLTWGTWPAGISWSAYLLGWFIKTLVVRLGGGRTYHRLKPVFVGLISAELISIALIVAIDYIYYWFTGQPTGVSSQIQSN